MSKKIDWDEVDWDEEIPKMPEKKFQELTGMMLVRFDFKDGSGFISSPNKGQLNIEGIWGEEPGNYAGFFTQAVKNANYGLSYEKDKET